jgi:hypothetical protein
LTITAAPKWCNSGVLGLEVVPVGLAEATPPECAAIAYG